MNFSKEETLVVTEETKTLVVPKGIKKLTCGSIRLETLILNEGIEYVDCSHNELTELIVPNSVTSLYCSFNKLTELIVPGGVTHLNCSVNQLTKLIVPDGVTYLVCPFNKITELIVTNGVDYLVCHNNLLGDLSKYSELIKPKVVSLYAMCYGIVNEKDIPKCFSKVDKVICDECGDKVVKGLAYTRYRGCVGGHITKTIKCKRCIWLGIPKSLNG